MTLSVTLQHAFTGFDLDVTFTAPPGLTVLFGRSGSGKTTVLNAIAGVFKPDAGRIDADGTVLLDTANGIVLPAHRRRIGIVFQEGRLFPHMNVRANLLYGRRFAKNRASAQEIDKVIETLGIAHLLRRRPRALSGGEKQRVAIGRALLASPSLIVADEPLASLDEPRKAEILPTFEHLRDTFGIPIIYVSHSAAEVARLATTVVALENGRVLRHGPAIEILADAAVTPAGVREAGAVLHAFVVGQHEDGLSELSAGGITLLLPQIDAPVGKTVRVRVAAHDVILARKRPEGLSALNILPGTVVGMRPGDGPGTVVTLDTAAGRLLARITQRSAGALELAPGVECFAVLKSLSVAPADVSTHKGASSSIA